jgi:peptide subunit release factor 1 (eRF1)
MKLRLFRAQVRFALNSENNGKAKEVIQKACDILANEKYMVEPEVVAEVLYERLIELGHIK